MSGVDEEDAKGLKERIATSENGDTVAKKDNRAVEAISSSSGISDANPKKNPSRVDDNISTNRDLKSVGVTTDITTSETSSGGAVLSKTVSNETRSASKPTMSPSTGLSSTGFTVTATSRNTSDPKIDSNSIHTKTERTEDVVTKPIVKTTAAVLPPKQSQQTQHQRYFVPSRQNQEEAVFKMVQNIFKLLETSEFSVNFPTCQRKAITIE